MHIPKDVSSIKNSLNTVKLLFHVLLNCVLSHTRANEKLRTNIRITKSDIWLQKCLVLPVVNGQRPVSIAFSCDTGTQDRRNRAGLQEGKRVRTTSTAIGRSCTFSMLWVGEGLYCPLTHSANRSGPPSEQLRNPFSQQSYVTVGLKGCQSALYHVDWWTRDCWYCRYCKRYQVPFA